MKRCEVYVFIGLCIMVWFFGGWDFDLNDVDCFNFVEIGYWLGVLMGGELIVWLGNGVLRFLVGVFKDLDGVNLDCI